MAKITIRESQKQFKEVHDVLFQAAKNNRNVILMGEAGIGKTHLVMDVAASLGLKVKYFSAATLDPFADLIGIPIPDSDRERIKYLRLQEINDAEVMFFDELNRSHKRVTNAVLEIIQFKSLNGDKLKNLRFCWAAVNPWDKEGYQTEALDIAVQGRFHYNIPVPYNVSYSYFENKYDDEIARIAYDWWWDLSDELRERFQPRNLDYMVEAIVNGEPFEYCSPFGVALPLESLKKAIELTLRCVSIDQILKNPKKYEKIASSGDVKSQQYSDLVKVLTGQSYEPEVIAKIMPVIIALPADYVARIIHRNHSYTRIRAALLEQKGIEELMIWDQKIQQKINS
jgi:hypothetical protein